MLVARPRDPQVQIHPAVSGIVLIRILGLRRHRGVRYRRSYDGRYIFYRRYIIHFIFRLDRTAVGAEHLGRRRVRPRAGVRRVGGRREQLGIVV